MQEERSLKLDFLALALLALTVFLGVALFTYDAADPPSTLIYPQPDVIQNACGRSGAFAAHVLFQGLGLGAYYFGGSLAVLSVLLLIRREISQPILRAVGWVASLVGITTLSALALDQFSPGTVVGAGGYLGAMCEGILESNFALVGAYILTFSVLLAGLLLCSDYILLYFAATTAVLSAKGVMHVGKIGQAAGRAALITPKKEQEKRDDSEEDEEDEYEYEYEDAEDDTDEEYEYEYEEEEDESDAPEINIRTPDDAPTEEEESSSKAVALAAAGAGGAVSGVKNRIKSALRIRTKKERTQDERQAVIKQLDKAVSHSGESNGYTLPPIDLLLETDEQNYDEHKKEVRQKAQQLEKAFASFGFDVKVVEIETGPVIAQYEIELESGLRLSKITGLADDIAIALRVPSVRIVAPIPGKNTVGIEVPNDSRQLVRLREVIEESNGKAKRLKIPIYLGKDVAGNPMLVDLAAMPHLLIAGRTGTGKSVCLNSIIVSILMGRGPDEVRMLMIDPKMVELSPYKKLPHLMHPVVTDMKKAEAILGWAVDKMEERYAMLANAGVRHVSVYNQLGEEELRERLSPEDDEAWDNIPKTLPYIVIIADEIADLMMTAGKDVEQHIIRLAQKSRAVGIHLILATQKPTVDVITGLIKSNLPARLAFQVASRTDSRVVLDEMGADKLLGNGDMLFLSPGTSLLLRGQGTYLSDDEITNVVDFVGTDAPDFVNELVQLKTKDEEGDGAKLPLKKRDDLYEGAVDVVIREGRGSVSLLQRTLGIGYGRSARLIDYMAEDGIVGEYQGSKARDVLITLEEWEAMSGGGEPDDDPTPPVPPRPKRTNKIKPDSASLPSPKLLPTGQIAKKTKPLQTAGSGVASAMLAVGAVLAPWEEEVTDDLEIETEAKLPAPFELERLQEEKENTVLLDELASSKETIEKSSELQNGTEEPEDEVEDDEYALEAIEEHQTETEWDEEDEEDELPEEATDSDKEEAYEYEYEYEYEEVDEEEDGEAAEADVEEHDGEYEESDYEDDEELAVEQKPETWNSDGEAA